MYQYKVFELVFHGDAPTESHVSIDLNAMFALDGEVTTIHGFYAGDGVYKVRYLPLHTGKCSWVVKGIFSDAGSEQVNPAPANTHGPVQAEDTHFAYADGTIYRPFGTTIYALIYQPQSIIEETMATLEASPFNKVRLCVFPKHHAYNNNEPSFFPFEKALDGSWDVTRPCFVFWDHLESCLEQLASIGIQTDLILFHPYGNAAILQYYGTQCTNKAKIELPNDQPYTISVIDSWNMTKMIVMTHAKGSVTVPMPSRESIAILAIAEQAPGT